mgnify:CR=1 FL=1
MIPQKPVTPPVLEDKVREKARTYPPCFSTVCPLREHCLHAIVVSYAPQEIYFNTSVNLCHPQAETENCSLYRSDKPVRMPYGLSAIYYDMPSRYERAIKNRLIAAFSRKRYYEYHNGTRPITPDVERTIRQVCLDHGWKQSLHFSGSTDEYLW